MSYDLIGTVKAALNNYARHGFYPMNLSIHEVLAALVTRCEQAEAALAAERIENAHLREAFVTMEQAYNANEAALAALRKTRDEALQSAHEAAHAIGNLTDELDALRQRIDADIVTAHMQREIDDLRREGAEMRQRHAELRQENEALTTEYRTLHGEMRALREQRCETCRYRRGKGRDAYCQRIYMPCEQLGHRCGAWARREP